MCGIVGAFSASPRNREVLSSSATMMIDTLKHRGPDDQGIWNDPSGFVSLGHCRLAIIDLSIEGRQPMVSKCGRYVIVFNGEIYNYLELSEMLQREGVSFRGHSDTEVFLEAVSRWGLEKSLHNSAGMFAFALWDQHKHILILARDRAGKKPLYYYRHAQGLYFASEIKAFKVLRDIPLSMAPDSIYQYLTFGYVPSPRTVYKGLMEVPAGYYMTFDKDLATKTESYWTLASEGAGRREVSFEQAVDEAEALLKEAVKIRLRADVPVGCFLSGGVDSGLLTAFAAMQMTQKLQTFTVSLEDGVFDESPGAAIVARQYGTEHHVLTIRTDVKTLLPKLVMAYDQPFADASAIPSLCISEEARKYVKVVINGEGGDELFGGYRRHLAMMLYDRYHVCINMTPNAVFDFINYILPQPRGFRSNYSFLHRYLRGLGKNHFDRYIAWCVDGFDEKEKKSLYRVLPCDRLPSGGLLADKARHYRKEDPFDQFMAWDFFLNMHDDMLVKMDIATMTYALEGRNPFLDHRLIEWAFHLPKRILLKNFNTKPILRALAKRYLPESVAMGPKRGFEIPLIRWLRGDLRDMVHDVCFSQRSIILDLFNRSYVEELLAEKLPMDPDRWSKRVWTLFMLAMWGDMNEDRIFLS